MLGIATVALWSNLPRAHAQAAAPPVTATPKGVPWPAVPSGDVLQRTEVAAQYLVALLNVRNIFPVPTTLERLVAAYVNAQAVPPRYFLVLEVAQRADPFIFLLEAYEDKRKNWIPIFPSPSKNFLALKCVRCNGGLGARLGDNCAGEEIPGRCEAGIAVSSPRVEQQWTSQLPSHPAVASARLAAQFILEKNYFAMAEPNRDFREERVVLAEVRVETLQQTSAAQRRRRAYVRRQAAAEAAAERAAAAALAHALVQHKRLLTDAQSVLDLSPDEALSPAHVDAREGELRAVELQIERLEAELADSKRRRMEHLDEELVLTRALSDVGVALDDDGSSLEAPGDDSGRQALGHDASSLELSLPRLAHEMRGVADRGVLGEVRAGLDGEIQASEQVRQAAATSEDFERTYVFLVVDYLPAALMTTKGASRVCAFVHSAKSASYSSELAGPNAVCPCGVVQQATWWFSPTHTIALTPTRANGMCISACSRVSLSGHRGSPMSHARETPRFLYNTGADKGVSVRPQRST